MRAKKGCWETEKPENQHEIVYKVSRMFWEPLSERMVRPEPIGQWSQTPKPTSKRSCLGKDTGCRNAPTIPTISLYVFKESTLPRCLSCFKLNWLIYLPFGVPATPPPADLVSLLRNRASEGCRSQVQTPCCWFYRPGAKLFITRSLDVRPLWGLARGTRMSLGSRAVNY